LRSRFDHLWRGTHFFTSVCEFFFCHEERAGLNVNVSFFASRIDSSLLGPENSQPRAAHYIIHELPGREMRAAGRGKSAICKSNELCVAAREAAFFRRKLSGRKPIDNVVTGDTFRRGGPSLVYAKFIESLRSAAREDTPPSEKYPESRLMPESRERCSARKQFLCGFAIITRPRNINFGLSPDIHDMQQLICSIFRLVVTLWTGNIASDIRLDGLVAQPEKRCSVILDRA
jgi:hypothetical protein